MVRTNSKRGKDLIDALQLNKNGYNPRKERQIVNNQIKMEV